jgi:hypothetical protein
MAGGSSHFDNDSGRNSDHHRSERDTGLGRALAPLIQQIESYDSLRRQLEEQGGDASDLARMTILLNQPVEIRGRWGTMRAPLADPKGLRRALSDSVGSSVHLQARRIAHFLPVFYLVRVKESFYHDYSLIVEDYYRSPGYPSVDDRFAQIQLHSHEIFELRLSPFRDGARWTLGAPTSEEAVDRLLYEVGRHVLQAAWHEDQRVAVIAAEVFDIPILRQAVEVLYLVLSGDLCALRETLLDRFDPLTRFFDTVYPQPGIVGFLEMLPHLDGAAIDALPRKALTLYSRLSTAFTRFLQVETPWGLWDSPAPLYKLLLGNFSAYELLGERLQGRQEIERAKTRLEASAEVVIQEILNFERRQVNVA